MKKPTAREFQYDKPTCLVMGGGCTDWFEPVDANGRRCCCSNCEIAFERKNKSEEDKK